MTAAASKRELVSGALARASTTLSYLVNAQRHRHRSFRFGGQRYRYHAALYNTTWSNERTVELPIAMRAVAERPGARLLEVGNVLAHYGVSGHTVVDKYESAPGVVNQDILGFGGADAFDLVVSISTLEHIGFEEEVPDPRKPVRVLEHLASLLASAGQALITFPLGYNPSLDEIVAREPERFGQMRGLRRVSADNRWVEAPLAELRGARYGFPYPSANAIVVATLSSSRSSDPRD